MPAPTGWGSVVTARLVAKAAALVAAIGLAGCPAGTTKSAEPPATCAKAGDICTFSPGKLGLCVESSDATALLCQSQH
jgi:hypothetical protein